MSHDLRSPGRKVLLPKPRGALRRALGALALLVFIAVYAGIAAWIGSALSGTPGWVQLIYFLAAGIAWAIPMRPLMRWINES